MSPRYKKIFREFFQDRKRSGLLILSLCTGISAAGTMLGAYSVLKREMSRNYLGTNPAHVSIRSERPLPARMAQEALRVPGVLDAEARSVLRARMKVEGEWKMLLVFVIHDFSNIRLNRFYGQSGKRVPGPGEMLVERTAKRVMKAGENSRVEIKLPRGKATRLKITGTVHDPGLAPAWQEEAGYAYISPETLRLLGGGPGFRELRATVRPGFDASKTARRLADWLVRNGYPVHEFQIPPPNRHPHQGQMIAVLALFIVFSFLLLLLSSILVMNAMETHMTRQIREIGLMKTIGARSGQIAGLYLLFAAMYALGALLISVPLGLGGAYYFSVKVAALLNLELKNAAPEAWTLVLQIGAGFFFPVFAAFFPIRRAGRKSPREMLTHERTPEILPAGRVASLFQNLVRRTRGSLRLALKNSFRARARTILTMSILAAGGALFMTALNTTRSWDLALASIYKNRFYDLEIRLDNGKTDSKIMREINRLPSVKKAEAWTRLPAAFARDFPYAQERTYPDQGHGGFSLMILPAGSNLTRLPALRHRALPKPGTGVEEAPPIVLNRMGLALASLEGRKLRIGDRIRLIHEGFFSEWTIAAFTEDLGSQGAAYVRAEHISRELRAKFVSNMIRVAFTSRRSAFVNRETKKVEALLEKEGIPLEMVFSQEILTNAVGEHMLIFITSLISIAVLAAATGLLGLMSGMSLSVLERTREIGILRTLGAKRSLIRNVYLYEGFLGAVFSLPGAILLAVPLSLGIGELIGGMSFRASLPFAFVWEGVLLWTALLAVGGWAAALWPAVRAANMTIREALAYEG